MRSKEATGVNKRRKWVREKQHSGKANVSLVGESCALSMKNSRGLDPESERRMQR